MRIFLHDYGRYSFIVELAEQLTKYDHSVHFAYSGQDTPRSAVEVSDDAHNLVSYSAIRGSHKLSKQNLIQRRRAEVEHGKLVVSQIQQFRPDIVISANSPLDSQRAIVDWCRRSRIPFVFWVQDLLGVAIAKILRSKLGLLGSVIGSRYVAIEARLLRSSDTVVAISEDFVPLIRNYGVDPAKIEVVPNWAPLKAEPLPKRANLWSEGNGLNGKFCFLYAGTMGMKHNPSLIYDLAKEFRNDDNVVIVVVAEGVAADWLSDKKSAENIANLKIMPFQPYSDLPNVLATGDVLVALLDNAAGVFSVPSKVLTYLGSKKPILLSAPAENLISRIVSESASGLVSAPLDRDSFVRAGRQLYGDAQLRSRLAQAGRAYAEENFDIATIAAKFNVMLERYNCNLN